MVFIKYRDADRNTTYKVNLDQVLWMDYFANKEVRRITFHFAGKETILVTDSQIGKEEFDKLLGQTLETKTTVTAL